MKKEKSMCCRLFSLLVSAVFSHLAPAECNTDTMSVSSSVSLILNTSSLLLTCRHSCKDRFVHQVSFKWLTVTFILRENCRQMINPLQGFHFLCAWKFIPGIASNLEIPMLAVY